MGNRTVSRPSLLGGVGAVAALALLVALLATAAPTRAGIVQEVLQVTTTADVVDGGDGELSLREAVADANTSAAVGVTILLVPGGEHVLDRCGGLDDTNDQGDLDHTADAFLVISGTDAGDTTVRQTCSGERVLHVLQGDATVFRATVTGGRAGGVDAGGGGVRTEQGNLNLFRSTLADNTSSSDGGGAWVGNGGTLDASQSLVRDNVADGAGGGLYTTGGLYLSASTVVDNLADNHGGGGMAEENVEAEASTVVGNTANELGGALYGGTMAWLQEATISDNHAFDAVTAASVHAPTILSHRTVVDPGTGVACSVDATSTGASYATDTTCGFDDAPGDVEDGADPQLGPLQDDGGLTPTMAPAAGSPLVDVLDPCDQLRPDQRGVSRPQGGGCDIGAVETPLPFSDVGVDHPFFDEIVYVEAEGITTGFPNGTYRPAGTVTRQAMAAFLFRIANEDEEEMALEGPAEGPTFTDVPASHPFHDEIEWLAATGITTGFADGTFRPGLPVSRQAIAAFLFRLTADEVPDEAEPAAEGPTFTDVPEDHPFYEEIEWLAANDLTDGYLDGTFRPGLSMTRQAMAAFLFRYLDLPLGPGGPGAG